MNIMPSSRFIRRYALNALPYVVWALQPPILNFGVAGLQTTGNKRLNASSSNVTSLSAIPYDIWHLTVVCYGGNSMVLTILQSVIYFWKIMEYYIYIYINL
jgi:hypothetical protein